jgi:hypothetical protein
MRSLRSKGDRARNIKPSYGPLIAYGIFVTRIQPDPAKSWLVLLEVLASTENERVLFILAAGPLEDLLVHHGDRANAL